LHRFNHTAIAAIHLAHQAFMALHIELEAQPEVAQVAG
jgi:hypothetical protein